MRILRDRVGVREADVRPRLAGVGRLVDAVARLDVAADARLAHADEDDVRDRLRDGDRADRRARDLAVGDRRPVLAAVGRLPQTAAGRAEVADLRLALHAGDRDRSAAAIGPDAAPPQAAQDHRVGDVECERDTQVVPRRRSVQPRRQRRRYASNADAPARTSRRVMPNCSNEEMGGRDRTLLGRPTGAGKLAKERMTSPCSRPSSSTFSLR